MIPIYLIQALLHLNDLYEDFNVKVMAICRNKARAQRRFAELFKYPQLSICYQDITAPLEISEPIDYIIHAASPASSHRFLTYPVDVIDANVGGTRQLLNLALAKQVKRFLFLSSGSVCGTTQKKVISESDSGELDVTDIRSCYGESKRMGENLCVCWNHQYGTPTVSVRLEHTYGPTIDLSTDNRVYAEFISNIIHNQDIIIKSNGTPERTFCYTNDAADAIFRVLLDGQPGEIYNSGNMVAHLSIQGLAQLLVSLFPEKKLKVVYNKRDTSDVYLEDPHKLRPIMSTAKIETLGYKPKYDIQTGFFRTISSIQEEIG